MLLLVRPVVRPLFLTPWRSEAVTVFLEIVPISRIAPSALTMPETTCAVDTSTFEPGSELSLTNEPTTCALAELQASIAKNPKQGDVIPGTNGVRKLRWSRAGMGKRGGVRVIYFVQDALGRIWLLTVYAKSSQENIAVSTLNRLKEVAENAEII